MRSGGCALQQTLTSEAASVLKHSLGLARRRGHAQVTPLHVAATLLSLRASSFRRACLKSHPLHHHHHHQTSPHSSQHHHPLQYCRALELCFNVALNRLPTTPTPNLLHTQQPSLSNALIAALKRAQAHQRRGCIEQQNQQPLLTIKVELEQLVISILDDPSVSRVMREAGFSSTAVKSNIEDSSPPCSVFQCYSSSGGVFSSPCSPSPSENQREITINSNSFRQPHFYTSSEYYNPLLFSPQKKTPVYPITESTSSKEDIKLVLDVLLRRKKKNTVIVGDSLSITEGLVGELMGRLDRGEVPNELKSTHFIKFQFTPVSLRFMKKDEVEMNLLELKRKVDSVASGGGGAIFYFGDLKWIVEAALFSEKDGGGKVYDYNPVDHIVAEIGKLFSDYGSSSNAKIWLMATASYQTYMRCQIRQPALETQWSLQAVLVPSGGLGLSLHASSVLDSKMINSQNPSHMLEKKLFSNMEEQDKLTCCEECASNYEKEAQLFKPGQTKLLPSWLQSHSIEAHQKEELTQLRRKWNRLCHYLHQGKNSQNQWNNILFSNNSSNGKIYPCNSSYPSWPKQGSVFPDSSSISFVDSTTTKPTHTSSNLVPRIRCQQSCTIEFNFSNGTQKRQQTTTEEPSLDSLKGLEGKEEKITLALGNSQFGGSEQGEEKSITDTAQLRSHVCKILQENVPWHSETIPSIVEALIDSKSEKETTTWLILQGNDFVGKRRLAHAITESFFGSTHNMLLQLDMKKKDTLVASFSERLTKALKAHEKLVILIENIDFADTHFKKLLADGYETGKFGQSIIIMTNCGSTSNNNKEKNQDLVMQLTLQINDETHCVGQKRKSEFDLFPKIKSPRILLEEKKGESNRKRDFSRQSSFNTLDLNVRADEQEADDDGEGESSSSSSSSSPISSDLTRETLLDPLNPNGFLDSIEKRFELNRNPAWDRKMAELFTSKIKGSFEEIKGKQNLGKLSVEEKVIEEMIGGCGGFTNSVFEKWLKDIFQRSLEKVNIVGKEKGIGFRLCWGGIGKGNGKGKGKGIGGEIRVLDSEEEGFKSSCLPKNIQVNYYMD
ncbi:protein SMAX1-LIKE 4-like [Senna tora]|uniref:Protein SMAX1-LIKE 4-like n=1 Tax=Senna tora TaxID=362788 RepID=A0A834T0B5_9FABA|nr:protein SMAX1-LIKE 4-like [Senna tora]